MARVMSMLRYIPRRSSRSRPASSPLAATRPARPRGLPLARSSVRRTAGLYPLSRRTPERRPGDPGGASAVQRRVKWVSRDGTGSRRSGAARSVTGSRSASPAATSRATSSSTRTSDRSSARSAPPRSSRAASPACPSPVGVSGRVRAVRFRTFGPTSSSGDGSAARGGSAPRALSPEALPSRRRGRPSTRRARAPSTARGAREGEPALLHHAS